MIVLSSVAMAETKFTPLNFDDSSAVKSTKTTSTITKATVDNKGTVLLVSHEPSFYEAWITKVWNIEEWNAEQYE